jgi:glycosyl transferase, family 25
MKSDIVYLLNLDERKDRLEKVEKRLQQLDFPYRRMSAWKSTEFVKFKNPKLNERNGGCFMSHQIAVMAASVAQHDVVGVFEDDIIFHPDFRNRYEQFVKNVPDDWEMVMLGTIPFEPHIRINEHVSKCVHAIGSWSYFVKKSAYKKFLSIRLGCDNKNDMFTAALQRDINVYCPAEGLTAQDPNSYSDLKKMTYGEFIPKWRYKHDFNYELWQSYYQQGKVF